MKTLESEVKKRMNFCLRKFRKYLGTSIFLRPVAIKVADIENSMYDFTNNIISISESHAENGIHYFEEASHFFRNMLRPDNSEKHDEIDEFFGRMGESLGRYFVQNTRYAYLFDEQPERDWTDRGYQDSDIEMFLDSVDRMQIMDDDVFEIMNNTTKVGTAAIGYLKRSIDILRKYVNDEPIELIREEVKANIQANLNILNQAIQNKMPLPCDVQRHVQAYLMTANRFNNRFLKEQKSRKNTTSKISSGDIEDMNLLLKAIRYDIKLFRVEKIGLPNAKALSKVTDVIIHHKGYIAAEIYMKENPDYKNAMPKIFRMPNDEVKKLCFNQQSLQPHYDKISPLIEAAKKMEHFLP